MSVVIFGVWNVPGLRNLINPLKLFTIGLHEMSHIIAVRALFHVMAALTSLVQAVLSGGRILRITIDPHIGGATIVEGGRPGFILPAGYIGSTLFGGLFVLAGWDTLVAKVMSFVLAIGLLMPLRLVRDKLYVYVSLLVQCVSHFLPSSTILLTIFYEGLLIGFWFVDHACAFGLTFPFCIIDLQLQVCLAVVLPICWHDEVRFKHWYPLRWLITDSILYVICTCTVILGDIQIDLLVGDVADDRFFHKNNDSDTTQFEIMFPRIPQHGKSEPTPVTLLLLTFFIVWATLWIMFSLIVLVGFALLGIFAFKRTTQEMYDEAGEDSSHSLDATF